MIDNDSQFLWKRIVSVDNLWFIVFGIVYVSVSKWVELKVPGSKTAHHKNIILAARAVH